MIIENFVLKKVTVFNAELQILFKRQYEES